MNVEPSLFTVGHSNHALEDFLGLLQRYGVETLIDVRSQPISSYSPHFNARPLREAVQSCGMRYGFYGRELGGRPEDSELYDEQGHVLYGEVARTRLFQDGLDRLENGLSRFRVAIMCSEEDPMICHRRLLVGRVLNQRGIATQHIRGDGRVHEERWGGLVGGGGGEAIGFIRRNGIRTRKGATGVEVFTIGFTKTTAEHFFDRLKRAGVKRLMDVRLNNVSQLAGFAKRDDLAYFLRALCGATYVHEPLLAPTQDILDAYKKK